MGINVLFIYPNTFGMNMLPPAIGLLSSILKDDGNDVELFDTTYYERLDETEIFAPINGVIIEKLVEEGQIIASGFSNVPRFIRIALGSN